MRALRWHGRLDVRLDEVPEPGEPLAGQALLQVSSCGLCGTDVHEYLDGPHMIRTTAHPLTRHVPPVTLGHEITGTVLAVGEGSPVPVGTRVAVDPCWRCGSCWWCRRGDYHLCAKGGGVGVASDGGFAPLALVPSYGLVALPDGVNDVAAAMAEPMAVALHAVTRGGVEPGTSVLVLGGGAVGGAIAMVARLAGAATVFVSDPSAARRLHMQQLGVDEVFDPGAQDVRKEVFVRTGRVGPDVVFECTGLPSVMGDAVAAARRGGRIVLTSIARGAAELQSSQLVFYERELVGAIAYKRDVARAIDLMASGRLDPERLVTGRFPLSEGVEVLREAGAHRDRHLKIIFEPGA
jgi:(R,R)-butanediol dehydrogenase/meso-butanediol dehydrogenase/diacetyl reductase